LSALAKSLTAFAARFTVHHDGRVWIPEDQWAKWLELARREVKAAARGPESCGVCGARLPESGARCDCRERGAR